MGRSRVSRFTRLRQKANRPYYKEPIMETIMRWGGVALIIFMFVYVLVQCVSGNTFVNIK